MLELAGENNNLQQKVTKHERSDVGTSRWEKQLEDSSRLQNMKEVMLEQAGENINLQQ